MPTVTENNNFMYYVNENGQLRTIPLTFSEDVGVSKTWKCTPQEKYVVTGLYLEGKIISAKDYPFLVDMGLNPIEPFLFASSNLLFNLALVEYRPENIPFVLKFVVEKHT